MSDSQPKVRSFAVTIRPAGGITDEQIDRFVKFVKKHCEYYFIVTEKDDVSRHIHSGLFLKKSSTSSNLCTQLLRLYKDFSHEEKAVMRGGVKFMYNGDFITNYMDKDDDTVVIERCLPEKATMDSYFSEVPAPKKKGPTAADPFYANLESLWWKHKRPIEETNPVNLRNFLMKMMNVERVIRVISDNRKIFQISVALSRYINKEDSWKVEPEAFHQDF